MDLSKCSIWLILPEIRHTTGTTEMNWNYMVIVLVKYSV